MGLRAGIVGIRVTLAAAVLVGAVAQAPSADADGYPEDGTLRLNHVQHLASHNSYRERSNWPVSLLVPVLDYSHAPLGLQLDLEGVRGLELDVLAATGGRFLVKHIPVVDENSTCTTLVACLQEIEDWSDANAGHAPLLVQIEPKDDLSSIKVADRYDQFDAAIRSVLPPEKLITPDDVRGTHESLVEAVAADGWPTLAESRGKVLFFLDVGAGPLTDKYVEGHPQLEGRVAFPNGAEGEPWAVVFVKNDPVGDFDEIQDLVSAGYIVRTRADDDVRPEPAQTAAALASGAQIVSTDFESPGHDAETDSAVTMPGGTPSRCNPVAAPPSCDASDIETGLWTPHGQHLSLQVSGPVSWSTSVDVAPGTFTIGVPGGDFLYRVAGTAVVPGAVGGDATVKILATPFLGLPLFLGSVVVEDPGAGVHAEIPLLFTPLSRKGVNGASGSTGWCSFAQPKPGCGKLVLSVETL